MTRAALIRLIATTVAVTSALGIGLSTTSAQADEHPAPCGYVEVGNDSTTTTETVVSYCNDWTCGPGGTFGPNPGGAFGITWDYFFCIDNM